MSARIESPTLGTMIQVAEVSQLTGIPMGTVRLWRQEKYKHLAKFKTYEQAGTRAKWYRLADVQLWIDTNEKPDSFDGFTIASDAPNAFEAPINGDATPHDFKRVEMFNAARKINRVNWYKKRVELTKGFDNVTATIAAARKKWLPDLTAYWFEKQGSDPVPFLKPLAADPMFPAFNVQPAPEDQQRHDFIMVAITRLMDAEIAGRELSVADVVTLPVE